MMSLDKYYVIIIANLLFIVFLFTLNFAVGNCFYLVTKPMSVGDNAVIF